MSVPKTKKATAAQRAALIQAGVCTAFPDLAREQRLRRWACRVVSDLPCSGDDGQRVLDLAGELLRGWADSGVFPTARSGRTAR